MGPLIAKRLGTLIPVVLGVTFLSFVIINVLPGNIALQILGDNSAPGALQALEKELGLNQPIPIRYWHWLDGVAHGNLGTSMSSHQPVATAIWNATPPTVELIIYALIIGLFLTMTLAFLSVWTRSRILDRFITVIALAGISIPGFVIGIVLLLIFSVKLHSRSLHFLHPILAGHYEESRSDGPPRDHARAQPLSDPDASTTRGHAGAAGQ